MDGMIKGLMKSTGDDWRGIRTNGRKGKERINEEEKVEEGRIEEWDEEDEMGKMGDLYDEL